MNRRLLAITPVDHPGGAERGLLRLLAALRGKDWTIAVTTPGEGPLREEVLRAGYEWHALPLGGLAPGSGMRAISSWPPARRLARDFGVVYLNGGVSGRLLPALAPVRRGGRPRLVLHIHDMVNRVPRFWYGADLVLADSQAVARRLKWLSAEVVYCPVDPEPPSEPAPWPTENGPVVGFIGRLEPRKGPLDLVRAAPAIRRSAPGARVVLVGDEPYGTAPEYTRAVRAAREVEHHPWCENAPGLMRHLDVLVLPSYEEPFGTVLAEAMAVGTPVVATRVGGLPEVVQDHVTGRLVDPGDPHGLAAAVLDVLSHKEEMGAAALRDARRFHVDGYVERVERLIGS
jgi:glycosyltransferase involved in cell wall biosynthesis